MNEIVIIDSKDRATTSTSSANFTTDYIMPYYKPTKFALRKILIPHSFYNVNTNNNTLIIDIGAGDVTITLTNGNYTQSALQSHLDALLKLVDAALACSYNTNTKKFTISWTSNFQITLSTSKCNILLGFGTTDLTGASTYSSTNIPNLSPKYLNLHSEKLSEAFRIRSTRKLKNIIHTVLINTSFGENIIYEPEHAIFYDLVEAFNQSFIDFYLTDEFNNSVDLNGNNFIIVLEFI